MEMQNFLIYARTHNANANQQIRKKRGFRKLGMRSDHPTPMLLQRSHPKIKINKKYDGYLVFGSINSRGCSALCIYQKHMI